MVFNSLAFILFFMLVIPAYFVCPLRWRWLLLLIASCYFYMALVPQYILILGFIIVCDFFLARRIELAAGKTKRLYLFASLAINIGTLFFFKYFNFFNQNIAAVAQLLHWNYSVPLLNIILPLGLSFHTFQSLSYIIEVYRGKFKAERHFGIYALYVMFFPQLVAGPIERPQHLLPQLHKEHPFEAQRFQSGLQLMLWGFFKKIVIADRLAQSVDYVYGHLRQTPGLALWVVLLFFAFELYADFSGYCDIAIGCARLLGIDLTQNFNHPYFATSVADFWRRWHISLSNWLRDYLYFPLATAAKKTTRTWLYACLFITFIVCGLWHGANWTYVVMGAYFGGCIVLGMIFKPKLPFKTFTTFLLVCFGWVFFRAPNLSDAFYLFTHLFSDWGRGIGSSLATYGVSQIELALSAAGILTILAVETLQTKMALGVWLLKQPVFVRTFVYATVILLIITLGSYTNKQFIYFQF